MKVLVILLLGLARSVTPKELPRFGLTTFGEQCLGKCFLLLSSSDTLYVLMVRLSLLLRQDLYFFINLFLQYSKYRIIFNFVYFYMIFLFKK